jgi:integrase
MSGLDAAGTAELIETARPYRAFMPIVLGVLCGMRGRETAALRWRSVDLDAGQLAVAASTEQIKTACRERDARVDALISDALQQRKAKR